MADSVVTKCAGLWTQGSPLSAPEGALAVAENAVLNEDDAIEMRRGVSPVASVAITRLFPFAGGLVGWGSDGHEYSSADGASWSSLTGSFPAPSGAPMRAASAAARLYLTGSTGLRRMTALGTAPVAAGMPAAPDVSAYSQLLAGGSLVPNGSSVAYRVVWGKRIGTSTLLGAPSGRATLANSTGGTTNPQLVIIPPPEADGSFFFQVYRSEVAASGETPTDEMALVTEAVWPAVTARAISVQRAGNVVTVTTDVPHGLAGQSGVGQLHAFHIDPGDPAFSAITFSGATFIDTPTATTLRYSQAGADAGPVTVSAAIERVGYMMAADSLPDDLRQAALYTSPSQEGALAGNMRPPVARDVCSFRGSLVFANLTLTPTQTISYLGGIVAGDTVTVNGVTFTAGTDFGVGSIADPMSKQLRDVACYLVDAVNRRRPAVAQARYASSDSDFPGKIAITGMPGDATLTIATSRPSSFGPTSLGATAESHPAGVAWTKQDQPEAVSAALALVPKDVASQDKAILRSIPTRDSVFLFKDGEGTYRLSGETPDSFRIDPFDLNCHLVAPETAVALDNKVLMLTEQGIVAVTDTGVELLSRAIEPSIKSLLMGKGDAYPTMRAATKALAFAVAYESERKYILFAPKTPADTMCTQAWVLDLLAFGRTGSGWTHWDLTATHGLVNPADDKLYLLDGTTVHRERKDGDLTDYADESYAVDIVAVGVDGMTFALADVSNVQVGDAIDQAGEWGIVLDVTGDTITLDRVVSFVPGAATSYRAIPFGVEWLPKFAPPGKCHHFIEAALQFRRASFSSALVGFATDLDPDMESLEQKTAWRGDEQAHATGLFPVPRNKARGAHLRVRFDEWQARSPISIEALTVAYSPGTASVRPRVFGADLATADPFDVVPLYS